MQIIQIQTIDSCNAKCFKCPYPHTYHTKKMISDDVFLKIIREAQQLIDKESKTRVALYLNNEPLLDPLLFKRAEFIKKTIPNVEIEISTNCLLLPKYKSQVVEYFDRIILSLMGWDCESYNLIHRTKITPEYYDRMKSAYEYVSSIKNKEVFAKCWNAQQVKGKIEDVDSWYNMAYSRAGFLDGNKIKIRKLDGCLKDKHKIWTFLDDGTMLLCCMDYIKEIVLGNIKYQSLKEILSSSLAMRLIDKVEGKLDSEEDFICKRCELAKGVRA